MYHMHGKVLFIGQTGDARERFVDQCEVKEHISGAYEVWV